MWTPGFRDDIWKRLDEPWDVVIIGGGITGAGILGEAIRNGHKAILIEGHDFASGTSSRSTKLVHGGLRYLRQGQFLVTRKSVRERERLMREGAGLVEPLGFSLAAFPGDQIPRWMFGMGLAMYDALAWKWAHEKQTVEEIVKKIPPLEGSAVQGGYRYFDAQTDDTRLVIRVLREAVRHGGVAINYCKATDVIKDKSGKVCGVKVRDRAPGATREAEVRGKVVINATGAWADKLRVKVGAEPRMRQIRGSHITFSHERLPIDEAVSLLHPKDGRAVFAVPWEGVTIFGTTDKDHGELNGEPRISDEEVEYLLECARRSFPHLDLKTNDVIASYAGVRPVINTGASDPSKESREHAIWREDGLLTIAGGKLTTFAVMARDALSAAEDDLGPLKERTRVFDDTAAIEKWPESMKDADRQRMIGRYGEEAKDILADRENAGKIAGSIASWAELAHAASQEGVVKLEDLLLRRVRLGFLLPGGGTKQMAAIRKIAQPRLGWSDETWEREVKDYARVWTESYGGK